MLKAGIQSKLLEAGCDEAGRGCLCGPVYAAAVILPADYKNGELTDSKKLSEKQRLKLRDEIMRDAIDYSIAFVDEKEIDKINILNASIKAMHKALDGLKKRPEFIAVDGNRFKPYKKTPHQTIVQGDAIYLNIAAASILAKTERDFYIEALHAKYPIYNWKKNKGYATAEHRAAILKHGRCEFHRFSFVLKESQLEMF